MTDAQARLPQRRRPPLAVFAGMFVVLVVVFMSRQQSHARTSAREGELRTQLAAMRAAIHAYHAKHQANPPSLDALVRDGELRAMPVDPVTSSNTTWRVTTEESVRVDDFQPGAAKAPPTIVDVHSGAPGVDSSGRPFADY